MRCWMSVLVGAAIFAQEHDTRPRFEVAAIRPCNGREPPARLNFSPGRLSLPCFGLVRLIQEAYLSYGDGTLQFVFQPPAPAAVEGFPDELASYRCSIDAKAGSPESLGMMRGPMTQRLFEERFHLKFIGRTESYPRTS